VLFAANSIFLTGVGADTAEAVVGAGDSLLLTGAEYAGNVGGRTGAMLLVSLGGSLATLVLTGIRGGGA